MPLSNLTTPYNDLDSLDVRSNTGNDSLADNISESPTGVYTSGGGGAAGEIVVDANNKKIYFQAAASNNFANAGTGITGQALYSFLKYIWKNIESITKFDFPMLSITNEQFEFINGWYLDDAQSITQTISQTADVTITNQNTIDTTDDTVDFRKYEVGDSITITGSSNSGVSGTVTSSTKTQIVVSGTPFANATESTQIDVDFVTVSSKLVRTAGWTVQDTLASYVKEYYAGTISLGSLVDVTDQPYYIQQDSAVAPITNLSYTGPANEAVVIRAVADSRVTASGGNNLQDIVFTTSPNQITSTTTDLSVFNAGDIITVTGGVNNGLSFTVTGTPSATALDLTSAPTAAAAAGVKLESDRSGFFKLFVRERGKTYGGSNLDDIGVETMTYIVYRYPVTNATDLNITTTADTDIDSNDAVPPDVSPYSLMQISYLKGISGEYVIKGDTSQLSAGATINQDEVWKDGAGRWFKVTATGTIDANGIANYTSQGGTATLAAYEGERYVKNAYYAFTVIIDADDTFADTGGTNPYVGGSTASTVEAVYEFAQWALRLTGQLNEGATGDDIRNGKIADLLVDFVGPTLVTRAGVFIDSLATNDQNSIQFTEISSSTFTGSSNLVYPTVVSVTFNFNTNLAADTNSRFYAYYKTGTADFGTSGAVQLRKVSPIEDVGTDVSNDIPNESIPGAGSSYNFNYDYSGDTTNGRTGDTDFDIVVVAIGLDTGQYVKAEGTIESTGAVISLVAPLERNFSDPN